MGRTGQDLFRLSTIIDDLTKNNEFIIPLSKFQRRVAYANVYGTDFQVPTSTAAFWEEEEEDNDIGDDFPPSSSSSLHHRVAVNNKDRTIDHNSIPPPPEIVMILETNKKSHNTVEGHQTKLPSSTTALGMSSSSSPSSSSLDESSSRDAEGTKKNGDGDVAESTILLSTRLNELGWTKVLCDVRRHILPSFSFLSSTTTNADESTPAARTTFTVKELLGMFDTGYGRNFPLGHTIAVANSKDLINRWITKGGRPIMDYLANDILNFFDEMQQQQQHQEGELQLAFAMVNNKDNNNMNSHKRRRANSNSNRSSSNNANFKKKVNVMSNESDDGKQESTNIGDRIMAPFRNSVGGMILFPFVFIFGLDLVLNILALAKRSFEYFVLGQIPSTEPWY
jgi:hypothetical protein